MDKARDRKRAKPSGLDLLLTWRPTQAYQAVGAARIPIGYTEKRFAGPYEAAAHVMQRLNHLERGSARIALTSGQIIDIRNIEAMYVERKKKRGTD